MSLAPIVLFVYNRPSHTQNTIKALKKNTLAKESDLIVYSDYAKNDSELINVNKVREVIDSIEGFKSIKIIKQPVNKGLANSVIDGVTNVVRHYSKVIVLEDDLITSPYFLEFMNGALDYYQENKSIWSVSGYTPSIQLPNQYRDKIYLTQRASSWGWATWDDRWESADWEIKKYKEFLNDKQLRKNFNKSGNDLSMMLRDQMSGYIDSWAIRWCYNQFLQQKYTVYPTKTLIINKGLNLEGTHGSLRKYKDENLGEDFKVNFCNPKPNNFIIKNFSNHYRLQPYNYLGFLLKRLGLYKTVKKKIINRLK